MRKRSDIAINVAACSMIIFRCVIACFVALVHEKTIALPSRHKLKGMSVFFRLCVLSLVYSRWYAASYIVAVSGSRWNQTIHLSIERIGNNALIRGVLDPSIVRWVLKAWRRSFFFCDVTSKDDKTGLLKPERKRLNGDQALLSQVTRLLAKTFAQFGDWIWRRHWR